MNLQLKYPTATPKQVRSLPTSIYWPSNKLQLPTVGQLIFLMGSPLEGGIFRIGDIVFDYRSGGTDELPTIVLMLKSEPASLYRDVPDA